MVRDRWYTTAPDGTRTPTADHGCGSRWETGYNDHVTGRWHRRRFLRLWHARMFERDITAARRGTVDLSGWA
jgi:hypothetical protein